MSYHFEAIDKKNKTIYKATFEIDLVRENGDIVPLKGTATVTISGNSKEGITGKKCRIIAENKDENIFFDETCFDVISTFQKIRVPIEERGYLIYCNGCSKHFFSHGMLLDTGHGFDGALITLKKYKEPESKFVNFFERDADVQLCTFKEHEEYKSAYYRELHNPKVKHIPSGYDAVSPVILVRDAAGFLRFLDTVFNGRVYNKIDYNQTGLIERADYVVEGTIIIVSDTDKDWPLTPSFITLFLKHCDSFYKRAMKANATSICGPYLSATGIRHCCFQDPFGNFWWLNTNIKDVSEKEFYKRKKEPNYKKKIQQYEKAFDEAMLRYKETLKASLCKDV